MRSGRNDSSTAAAIRPRAIFLDPLVRMKGASRDGNDENEMVPVLNFLRTLRNESGSAVVFVHHTGHNGTHARGTSDFEAYWKSRLGIAHAKSPAATSVKRNTARRNARPIQVALMVGQHHPIAPKLSFAACRGRLR